MIRHFIDLYELTGAQLLKLLKDAERLKNKQQRRQNKPLLAGRVLGMVFEKPSLRTRVSFQAAMAQLGGASIFLQGNEAGLGVRESLPDFARTLNEYVDALVLRTFSHDTVQAFAEYASCPIINGLSDYYHPCQAIGDLLTMREQGGELAGQTLAFIGDGNNVARSLAVGCGKLGVHFILSAPEGYGFDKPFLEVFRREVPEGKLSEIGNPAQAVKEADFIYTDVWTSMGQEKEREERRRRFNGFQVNEQLLQQAPAHVKVMHCLPAKRGEEITDDVLDSDRSIVFPQAGNRMHAQKALLVWLLG